MGAVLFLQPARSTAFATNCELLWHAYHAWNQLASSIKFSKSIVEFKTNLKQLGNIDSDCAICTK